MKQTIKYPKLWLLFSSFILAYVLYQVGIFDAMPQLLHGHGYISMFLGGLLFSFGFTTPFAIAIFLAMADTVHPVLGALIGGLGAVLGDLTIFTFIRFSFMDEVHRLKTTSMFRWAHERLHHESIPERIRQYILWSVAGLVIASPLPDEIGVTLLSGLTEIKEKQFAVTCYIFNTFGIMLVLLAANALLV